MRTQLATNVRRYRGKMTQQQLADSAGLGITTVRKIEQADPDYNPTLNVLVKVAGALDIPLSQLVKEPVGVPTGNPSEGVMAIRRVLSPVDDLLGTLDVDEDFLTLRDAERAADYAWGAYWGGRYDHLAAILPSTILQLRATVHAVPLDERPRACELLARLYWCTGCTLVHLGQTDPAFMAVRQALDSANLGTDPLLSATLRGSVAWQLLVQGRYEESRRICVRAADDIEPAENPSLAHLSAYGSLIVTAATAAGRDQRVGEANHMIEEARKVADRMGVDRHDYETYFGPSQVTMQAVDVAVVTQNYTGALDTARAMPRGNGLPLASKCRHLADKSLALTRTGHHGEALDALLAAEAMGPDWIRHQALPKQIVAELLDHDGASRLRQFANHLGVRN